MSDAETSYRESHKAADKGRSYDNYYATEPWHQFLWERERMLLGCILKEFFSEQDVHLLDFACGTGRITKFLEDYVTTSVGVDISPSMLAEARSKLESTELIEADLTKVDALQGRQFNLITSFRFFLNAEPTLRITALKAVIPHLADDGYFVLNNHRNLSSPLVYATSIYNRLRGGNANFMYLSQVKDLVESVGLEIVQIYPVGVLSIRRFSPPISWHVAVDDFVLRHSSLAFLSQSPIIVCRWGEQARTKRR